MLAKINELHTSISDMKTIKAQVEEKLALEDDFELPQELTEAGKLIVDNIDAWIETLISQDREFFQDALNWPDQYLDDLHVTFGNIYSAIPPIPRTHVDKYNALMEKWPEVIAERERILAEDLDAFNTLYSTLGLPAILLPGEGQESDAEPVETTETATTESED